MNTRERMEDRSRKVRGGFDARLFGKAIVCVGVVCATVIGVSTTAGLLHPQVAHAATAHAPTTLGEAAHLAAVDRVRANAAVVAEIWAADESSHGMRPDAAH